LKDGLTVMFLAVFALRCLCEIEINTTDPYVIPPAGFTSFVIYPSANGVRLILRDE
jgi:hypothetical protein